MANERNYKFNFTSKKVNNLFQQHMDQSLDIFGIDIVFIPLDEYDPTTIGTLFKELQNKNYSSAYKMRVLLEDSSFFQGNVDVYSKFGLSIEDEVVCWVSRLSFYERLTGITFDYSKGTVYEDEFVNDNSVRPKISDLVYFPMYQSLFEISFVEDDEKFYSGHRAFWKLICKKYKVDVKENIDITATGIGSPLETGAQDGLSELIDILNDVDDAERQKVIDIYMNYGETGSSGYDPDDTDIDNDNFEKDASENRDGKPYDPFEEW